MPIQCKISVIPKNKNEMLSFGSVFNECLNAFNTIGAYSDLTLKLERFLTKKIALSFCMQVLGTCYGHYPLHVPTFVDRDESLLRTPFFHFSTLAEENIENVETELSIVLDSDEHAFSFLIQVALCLIQNGHRVFFTQDTARSKDCIELTKESVAKTVLNAQGTKQ